jgi:hypothetical protein
VSERDLWVAANRRSGAQSTVAVYGHGADSEHPAGTVEIVNDTYGWYHLATAKEARAIAAALLRAADEAEGRKVTCQ